MVLSGGMDSVTMLHEYASEIEFAVNFSYGSNHNARELECARYHCAQLGIELVEIDLEFIARYFHSSLLEGPDAVPGGDYDFDSQPCRRPRPLSRLPQGFYRRYVEGYSGRNL